MNICDKKYTYFAILFYAIIHLTIHLTWPTIGDDNARALLTDWPIHENIQLTTLYTNENFKLISSNIEPILAIKTEKNLYPILFQARESGFTYLIYKIVNTVLAPKYTLVILSLLISTLSFWLMSLVLKQHYSKVYRPLILLLCTSPILIFFNGPYLPDKLLTLFTWLLIYSLSKKKSNSIIIGIITFGLLVKITFIWNIAIALFFTKTKVKSITKNNLTLSIVAITLLSLPLLNVDQLIFELWNDHSFIKDLNFYLRFPITFLYLLFSQSIYLQYFTNFNNISFETAIFSIQALLFSYVTIISFIKRRNYNELKNLLVIIIVYSLLVLISVYQFSNFSDYLGDLVPFILIFLLLFYKKHSKHLFNLFIFLNILSSTIWISKYIQIGPTEEISYKFHKQISDSLLRINKDSLTVNKKYDLGIIDFISDGKVVSVYKPNTPNLAPNICTLEYLHYNWGEKTVTLPRVLRTQLSSNLQIKSGIPIYGRYDTQKASIQCKN